MTAQSAPQTADAINPWNGFDVTGPNGAQIPLNQKSPKLFSLGNVTITYTGDTGLQKYVDRGDLDPKIHDHVRTIDQKLLPTTDLASVPGPMRWFTNTYGPHTPAALIHDYLIPDKGEQPIMKEEYADRYFRFMLGSVGVPRFKSFIMWTAVAFRTRALSQNKRKPIFLAIYVLAAAIGLFFLGAAIADLIAGDGQVMGANTWVVFAAALVAPIPFSALWGRQFGAGLVTSLAAPWLLPAAAATSAGYAVYLFLERGGQLVERVRALRLA